MTNSTAKALKNLREEFARFCVANDNLVANDNVRPLKDIMLVGAFNVAARTQGQKLLAMYDHLYLNQTLAVLQDYKIPVHRDFNVDILNIEPDEGGRDFLKETKQADLVVLCFVFNPSVQGVENLRNGRYSVSENHFDRHAWHDAAVRVGAKAISVNYLGDSEIMPDAFLSRGLNSAFEELTPFANRGPSILVRKPGR